MRAVVVVPTYNEAENMPCLVARLQKAAPGVDLLIADDASPDGTADAAELAFAERPGYRVYRRDGLRGLGRAYVDAFHRVLEEAYDLVVQMDADLSHDPAVIPRMLEAAASADVVVGSRYCAGGGVQDWPTRRVLLSRYANVYVRLVTGVPTADATSGFRCWRREALEALDMDTIASRGYCFMVEMIYRAHKAGLRIAEVPITFRDRRLGKSKMSTDVIAESVLMPWRLRFRRQRVSP